jgi:SAM-dependent methyltransferase
MTPAEHWAQALADWALPEDILARAPASPWAHPPALFRHEPERDAAPPEPTPSERRALEALGAGGSVLDVGCGGGRSSIPLVPPATELVGVDENPVMLRQFAEAAAAAGVPHQTVEGRWPDVAPEAPTADVVVCHHVVYNVAAIEPFLHALTEHARRRVVVELPDRHPQSSLNGLWVRFWALVRPSEPTGDQFVEVVRSCGYEPTVDRIDRPARRTTQLPREEQVAFVRQRLCLTADRDPDVEAAMADGFDLAPVRVLTVSWTPA